ncbi:purine-nucleoside phosphorylase [Pontibacter akesuensis]|uniref:Purine nucleoside phosphorylase n=1 Tax=Pontibacter akesuensis TaxID=388950 RepID=A0A1I7H1Q5_9BACT|nr:purine-nucleoside phosphorylase [Pontibacter akesuensis]GHA53954.1 purine nucleoside phosphorylase [Pontibacter akesuensis]SFU54611.1 purine-nucleoside phosphorylase [Pontibacter akesuensis]
MILQLQEATDYIQQRIENFAPEFGIILGTGLGALVNELEVNHTISYDEIPYFPVSTVESHSGKLIFGLLAGRRVVVMQGRFHYYEGYSMEQVVFPVRVMRLLGVQKLFVSNAAGGLNPDFTTSELMIITDHINLQPSNPLIGKNLDELGLRFPDMSDVYDEHMVREAMVIGDDLGITLQEGVYVSVPGPMLETPAEYRYLRVIGADAVGMSTVPEVIAARHMGMPVFAVSVITDMCTPDRLKKVKLADILEAAAIAEPRMTALIAELIRRS